MRLAHRLRVLAGVAILGCGLAVGSRAQVPEGAMALSLQDALKAAMQNNFDIRVDQVTLQESDEALKGSYGIYDTLLNFTWYSNVQRLPTTSRLQVGELTATYMDRQDAYNLGVTQPTSWGQSFQFLWNNNRALTNSQFSYLNPTYNSSAQLGTTLPLLQGFGKTVASRTVLLGQAGQGDRGERVPSKGEGLHAPGGAGLLPTRLQHQGPGRPGRRPSSSPSGSRKRPRRRSRWGFWLPSSRSPPMPRWPRGSRTSSPPSRRWGTAPTS